MKRETGLPHVEIPVVVIKEPCLLTPRDAARLLSVAPSTLHWWRCRKHLAGPSFVKVEGRIRYQLQVLKDFISMRTVRTPARIPKSFSGRKERIDRILTAISRERGDK
jgi:hypothetical protein